MKIVVAIDSFKNSMTSKIANKVVVEAFENNLDNIEIVAIPISDGGEGLVESLTDNLIKSKVIGPLGNKVDSFFGLLDQETAVIEVAAASGIEFLNKNQINANYTTSYGVGELILRALDQNVSKIIIGLGGTATNDLGIGMLSALGVKFLNKNNEIIGYYGKDIFEIATIDDSELDSRLKNTKIIIAADVTNPLYGKNGATHVYGQQKGLTYTERTKYDNQFKRISKIINEKVKKDFTTTSGAGAAGGLGYSLLSFTNAKIMSGFDLILEKRKIKYILEDTDILVTGEGKIDNQTLNGKAPYKIAKIAKELNPKIKVFAFCGIKGQTSKLEVFDQIININKNDFDKANWLNNGPKNLTESAIVLTKHLQRKRD